MPPGGVSSSPMVRRVGRSLLGSVPDVVTGISRCLISATLGNPGRVHGGVIHRSPALSRRETTGGIGVATPTFTTVYLLGCNRFLSSRASRQTNQGTSPRGQKQRAHNIVRRVSLYLSRVVGSNSVCFPALHSSGSVSPSALSLTTGRNSVRHRRRTCRRVP